MVKTTARIALVAALVLAAVSCDLGALFSASIFPAGMTKPEAWAALGWDIPADRAWGYSFQIARDATSGAEYLALASDDASFQGSHLVVLDADLRVLGRFTLEQLNAMDPANPFNGRSVMVDKGGRVVVGNRRFAVVPGRIAYEGTVPTLKGYGLAFPEAVLQPNLINIQVNGLSLECEAFPEDWSAASTFLSWPMGGSALGYKLAGTWLTATDVLLLVYREQTLRELDILRLPRANFPPPASPATPLMDNNPWVALPFGDTIDWNTLGFTDEGLAAFRWDTGEYVRCDQYGAMLGTPVKPEQPPKNERHLYGRTAGWYVLSMKDLTIARYRWWWQ